MKYLSVSKYYNHQNNLFMDVWSMDAEESDKIDVFGKPYLKINKTFWHSMIGFGIPVERKENIFLIQYKEHLSQKGPSSCMFNLSKMDEFSDFIHSAITEIFEFEVK